MVNYRIMKHLISKILTLTIDCILVFETLQKSVSEEFRWWVI